MSLESNRKIIKGIVIFCFIFFAADFAYKTINNITYLNRENCILFRMMPKFWFLVFEYFVELFILVVIGVFLAALLESLFTKYKRLYPSNIITAFLYASLLPVCTCATIPFIGSMREKIPFRTIIAFVVAAPLLSPYIIMLSFSVLGVRYAMLRICCAFFLSMVTGIVVEFFYSEEKPKGIITIGICTPGECNTQKADIYLHTYEILKKLIPYLVLAGIAGIAIELFAPAHYLTQFDIPNNFVGVSLVILAGIPVYFCNGAEILVLRPLIHQSGLALGTAIAFSLTSTAVCMTSIVMLAKFLGKKLTFILVANIIITTLLLGLLINMISPEISVVD